MSSVENKDNLKSKDIGMFETVQLFVDSNIKKIQTGTIYTGTDKHATEAEDLVCIGRDHDVCIGTDDGTAVLDAVCEVILNRDNFQISIKQPFLKGCIELFSFDCIAKNKGYMNGLYLVGSIGVIITARSIYMTKVFRKVEDIPAQFIHKQVKLRGQVKDVNDEGVLRVEHIPIMRVPFGRKNQMHECLPIHLAGIDLSPQGRLWLTENVLHKVVWFHLLHRTDSHNGTGSHLYSKIEIPQRLRRNIHVNEELIRQGLSKISLLSSLEEDGKMLTNKNLLLYLDRLVKLEHYASKKGVGMWTQSDESSWKRKGLKTVGYILMSPIYAVKWVYKKWKHKG